MEPAMPVAQGSCPVRAMEAGDPELGATRLRWYRAAEDRDRRLAAEWCATVGAPVVDLEPETSPAQWLTGARLQVISWNMWIGGGDLYRLLESELGVDCEAGPVGAFAAEPFVLLLQEVWRHSPDLPDVEESSIIPWAIDPPRTAGDNPDIVEAARRCGLALVYVPSARNGADTGSRPDEDKGNAILSNLPLSTPIAIDLPLEGGRKVAIAATVVGQDGQHVRVVTAHLDVASTLVRTIFSGYQTRVRQAMGLVDGLARAEADGYTADATVVGADMNTWAGNESALRWTLDAFPQSPEWDGRTTRGLFPTDHIFFRAREAPTFDLEGYERLEDTYSSDHHARRLALRYRKVE
jgi:endonuclease/exonuclease/phosphatase family metal-dependent hydrolase